MSRRNNAGRPIPDGGSQSGCGSECFPVLGVRGSRDRVAVRLVPWAWGSPQRAVSGFGPVALLRSNGAAITAVLDAPAGIYNVTDNEPLTKKEYANALADAVNVGWKLRVPGAAALLPGSRSTSLTRSIRATNRKIRETTQWQPRFPSAREGWKEFARLKNYRDEWR